MSSENENQTEIKEVLLQFVEGENEGVELRITPPRTLTLGRSEDCDIYLGEKKISRKHCQIIVEAKLVKVKDLHSTNGTFVNKDKIDEKQVTPADQIQVGTTSIQLTFDHNEDAESLAKINDGPTAARVDENEAKSPEPKAEKKPEEKEAPAEGKPEERPFSQSSLIDEALESEKIASQPPQADEAKESEALQAPDIGDFESSDIPSGVMDALDIEEEESSASVSPSGGTAVAPEELDLSEPSFNRVQPDENDSFVNSIPELMDEMALSSPESDGPPTGSGMLKGSLSAMGLADLLQTFSQNAKSGILKLSFEKQEGEIIFYKGQIQGAQTGQVTDTKAIYRMLTWNKGEFSLQALPKDFSEADAKAMPESIESILMEGFRQFDELKKFHKKLPSLESTLELKPQVEAPLSKLHPRVLDVLQLVINRGLFQNILDESPQSDLETTKIVYYLLKKKYVQVKK